MTLHSHLDGGILTIRSVGDKDLAEGTRQMQAALDLARVHCRRTGVRCSLLIDLRESKETKDSGQLRDVAAFLAGELDVLTGRIAVVVERGLRFGLARMFAVYGEPVGLTTVVFTDSEAARGWLLRGKAFAGSEEA